MENRRSVHSVADEVVQIRNLHYLNRAAAYLEATRLAGFVEPEARRFFGTPPEVPAKLVRDYLTPWNAGDAEARYLKRFADSLKSE